jgi:hypothetical protein
MKKILCSLSLFFIPLLDLHAQIDRRVVLVIIDGARYSETLGDSLRRFVPRMHEIARQGAVVDTMLNDNITVTKRAIPAIWCGSWSTPKDTVVNGFANQYATVPTVWEYFRKERGVDSTHAMYFIKWMNTPWIQSFYPNYGPAYWPWYVLQGVNDLEVWQNARSKMQIFHPELAVIYLPDVDSAPSRGWNAYTQAIAIADSIVGMLWDFLQDDPVYRNRTTLLVTNDHGRHLDGVQNGFISHGDGCWGCRRIMLLAVGAGIPRGVHIRTRYRIPDITPTIGSLLHFATPYATGKPIREILTTVSPVNNAEALPAMISLEQNYPNPFNSTTDFEFRLSAGQAGAAHFGVVSLKIYDARGREVATLLQETKTAGIYKLRWTANHVPSGIYFYRLTAGAFTETKKLMLLR